ncbi:hypothetical protein LCGC14_2472980, partial [marine sediment metagenome]
KSFIFSNLTSEFVTRHDLSDLVGRDKVALFNRLLDDLGIRRRLLEDKRHAMATIIIDQQLTKAWEE